MRPLSIPAFVIGVGIAIAFFKVYGVLTRPDVPTPVAVVVNQFAPGVKIGTTVDDVRRYVASMSYVPHLGFVGIPGDRGANLPNGGKVSFSQVRLLLDESTRAQAAANPKKATIDAVEIVTVESGAFVVIAEALTYLFRKAPREGCLSSSEEGNYREVHLWVTRNERGGVALMNDFGGSASPRYKGMVVTSVLAFTGRFAGSETLRGTYSDSPCTKLVETQ